MMNKIRLWLVRLLLPKGCKVYDFEEWVRLTAYHCLHGQLEEILVIRMESSKHGWQAAYKYVLNRQGELENELKAYKNNPININNDEERLT